MSLASKNSSHLRNDSGELVVFEAARYFSGTDENPGYYSSSAVFPHNLAREGRAAAAARMSLDIPAIDSHNLPAIQKQYMMREKKKYKQPSSPGGRLASFLNSLFNQTNSKKKKKSKTSSDDVVDDHDHTLDRRRSSISHFRITDSNSTFPASETPPFLAKTPTKSSYKDLKSYSDRQKAISLSKNCENIAVNNGSFRNPPTKWTADDEDHRKFGDVDEGEDSDSSSDLFDLPNLDFYSSGLPVYGTTNMGRIRIGAPISGATTV